MQQLLLLSAMRPERVTQYMVAFITSVLDQRQNLKRIMSPIDLTKVAKTVRADQIPLILFRNEPHLSVTKLQQFTSKVGVC